MRDEEPEAIKRYRQIWRTPTPRNCHTCDKYQQDGSCREYGERPPPEYTSMVPNGCPDWLEEIPF